MQIRVCAFLEHESIFLSRCLYLSSLSPSTKSYEYFVTRERFLVRATHVHDTRNRVQLRSFVRSCLAGKPIRVFIALQCVLSNHRPRNGAISFLRRRGVYLGARNEVVPSRRRKNRLPRGIRAPVSRLTFWHIFSFFSFFFLLQRTEMLFHDTRGTKFFPFTVFICTFSFATKFYSLSFLFFWA